MAESDKVLNGHIKYDLFLCNANNINMQYPPPTNIIFFSILWLHYSESFKLLRKVKTFINNLSYSKWLE